MRVKGFGFVLKIRSVFVVTIRHLINSETTIIKYESTHFNKSFSNPLQFPKDINEIHATLLSCLNLPVISVTNISFLTGN